MVRLRLSAYKNDKYANNFDNLISELKVILGPNIYTGVFDTIEEIAANLLIEKGYTISTAESCTGGAIAASLVQIAGISKVFRGSIVG